MVDFKFIYQFGDFYLDPKSQAFYFQSQEIKLEPRIFDVLHLMVQKPREVITKDEFFESVWQGKVVSDWALSRAIKVLRKTLQEYDENETVKTLYGKGYLFSYEVKVLEPEVYKELVTSTPNNGVETIEQAIIHHGVSTPAQRPDASKNIASQATAKKVNTEEGRLKYQTLLALILLSLLVIFLLLRSNDEHPTKDKAGIKSIVVLPITNISGSEEYEYLASGLTDVVIGQLAKEKSLKVISKTSASYYKNKNMTSKAIAEELNVETVLEGSIFPNKDKINLSFRLIDGKSEKLIWSVDDQEPIQEVYTLFKGTAEKLARRIVANSISGSQSGLIQEKTNSETYELYLRANFILNSRKAKNLQKAEAFLLLAIEKDPYFAEAYARLATVYIVMSSYTTGKRIDWFNLAKEYTDDALALDSNLSIAWSNLGLIELGFNYNLQEAERAFRKAISINPNNVDAKRYLAELLAISSNYNQALEILEDTWQKDSMNPLLIAVWGSTLMMDKQYDKALEKFQLAISFGGQMIWVNRDIAYAYQWRGEEELSLKHRYIEMKNIGYFDKGDQEFITATKQNGLLGFWQWRLPLLLEKWHAGKLHGCYIAEAYAGVRDFQKMLQWFNTGLEQKSEICFQLVKRSPEFHYFKMEPEFKSLLSKFDITI